MKYHSKYLNDMTNLLSKLTGKNPSPFFASFALFKAAEIAANNKMFILNEIENTQIPINIYCLALADSGFGKNRSLSFLDQNIFAKAEKRIQAKFEELKLDKIQQIALDAASNGAAYDKAYEMEENKVNALGAPIFEFDSGTTAGLKQLKNLFAYVSYGALNTVIDEIGLNLKQNKDLLDVFLELYDFGNMKNKVLKNSIEAKREETIPGQVAANMLMFGTPDILFKNNHEELTDWLIQGYARRTLFFFDKAENHKQKLDIATDLTNKISIAKAKEKEIWSNFFEQVIDCQKYVFLGADSLKLIYEAVARMQDKKKFGIAAIEQNNRVIKFIKLTGLLTMLEPDFCSIQGNSYAVLPQHVKDAETIILDSEQALEEILSPNNFYKLVLDWIIYNGNMSTKLQLINQFKEVKKSDWDTTQFKLLQSYAISQGYELNKSTSAKTDTYFLLPMKPTDLNNLILSTSQNYGKNYHPKNVSFSDLQKIGETGANWSFSNHTYTNDVRKLENLKEECNTIILDIDNKNTIKQVEQILENYKYFLYTTKSHTKDHNRFRVIIPTKYTIGLSAPDYKTYINNLLDILPINSDEAAADPCHKWAMYPAEYIKLNDGPQLFDNSYFLPNSEKNKIFQQTKEKTFSDKFATWIYFQLQEGNRNKTLFKYKMYLKDCGLPPEIIKQYILEMNSSIPEPLSETELENTILKGM